jgi:ATP/maltotriose-dependent transcriptional regulator MalT
LTFLAASEADIGDRDAAIVHARDAVAAATATGDPVRIVYAHAHLGRVLLMYRDTGSARRELESAATTASMMLTLLPWLTVMLAEVDLADGDVGTAAVRARQALALATATGVSYQEALAQRALGLAEAARGNTEQAVAELVNALESARRTTGEGYAFHWPIAFILESLMDVTSTADPDDARRWATTLVDHATAIGMHELAARGRAFLGLPDEPGPAKHD